MFINVLTFMEFIRRRTDEDREAEVADATSKRHMRHDDTVNKKMDFATIVGSRGGVGNTVQ
jgi:hypothetical protein